MQRAFRLFAVFALAISTIALTSPAQAATPTACNGIPATITGTPGNDTLSGTPGDDVILGLGGADVIDGGGGNDVICGGSGDDTIKGGDGADVAYGAAGNDDLAGGDGEDDLFGGPGDDTLRGNQDNDLLIGGAGNDLLNGGYGDDTMRGNDGDDRGFGGPGTDYAEGGPGADSLSGADDDDDLRGNGGDDMLSGEGGDDLLYGGADSDTADGGIGFDRCMGTEFPIDCEDDDLNDPPVAMDDNFDTNEDQATGGSVLLDNGNGEDYDPNGHSLAVVAVEGDENEVGQPLTLPSGAEIMVEADGSFTYDPNGMYEHFNVGDFAVDTFDYTIADPKGETDTATVAVMVDGVNDAPIAVDDAAGTPEDTQVSIDVLDNDSDVDSEISIASFTDPANGTVEEIEGELVYTPEENAFGVDTFTYTITDGELTDTATVTVTVGSVNDLPDAVDDLGVETDEDTPVWIDVLDNDSDIEDEPGELIITIVDEPVNGSVALVAGGVQYTPNLNYFGADSFTYEVTDTDGGTSAETANVAINVLPINDAPIALDDLDVVTNEDTQVSIDVLDNDTDVDSEISIDSFTDPANGSVEEVNGELVYTPDANFFGMDAFEYTITDGEYSDTATVTVTVGSVNDLPDAVDDLGVETDEDTPVWIDVLDNDSDVEDEPGELIITIVDEPVNGAVALVEGGVEYTPDADYYGPDSFTYEVTDTDGGTSAETATVDIEVLPINDAPMAVDDDFDFGEYDYIGFEGDVFEGSLFDDNGNGPDMDPDEDELMVVAVNGQPLFEGEGAAWYEGELLVGFFAVEDNGMLYFVSELPPGFLGVGASVSDTFEYTVTDGEYESTATVTITIHGENDDPFASDDGPYGTNEETAIIIDGLTSNDDDPDIGDRLFVSDAGPVSDAGAVIMVNPDGSVIYDPVGVLDFVPAGDVYRDVFEYTVSDEHGATDTASVFVDVLGINDTPEAMDDTPTTDEDTPVDIEVLANDEDADDGAILDVIALDFDTTLGTVTILPTNEVRYVPPTDFFGEDSFTYTITDGEYFSTATVYVTVAGVNDPPEAEDDEADTLEDTLVTIDVTDNDFDVEDEPGDLTPVIVDGPFDGSAEVVDGQIDYDPNPDFWGPDLIVYYVVDTDGGQSDIAFVDIWVEPVNDAPEAVDDELEATEDEPAFIDPTENDSDIDSGFWIDSYTQPLNGTVEPGEGDLVYTPSENFDGEDSFTYTITDGEYFSTATVYVTVAGVNDPPEAEDDEADTLEDTLVTIDVTDNDFDVEDEPGDLTPVIVDGPFDGSAEVVDGQIDYDPNPDFWGPDLIVYYVVDTDGGQSDIAFVDIWVEPVNDAPEAVDDELEATEDEPAFIDPTENDSDIDSGFWIDSYTQPLNGTVEPGEGDLVYTPSENFDGEDSFTYTITDGEYFSTATVYVTVAGVNDPPEAEDDEADTLEDTLVTIDVTDNDFDVEDEPGDLTPVIVDGPFDGSAEVVDGQIDYDPNPDFWGPDLIVYYVVDTDGGQSDIAFVDIWVEPVNDAPEAVDDPEMEASEGEPALLPVLKNDSDVDSGFWIDSFTQPLNGTVSIDGGQGEGPERDEVGGTAFIYTSNPTFSGVDKFTYTITDGEYTDTATVTITVAAVNDLPVANDDLDVAAVEDTPIIIDVTANDTDEEDDPADLAPSVVTEPEFGTVELVEGGLQYTPNDDYNGADSFTYEVTDLDGGVSKSPAAVTINVASVNDDPVAKDDAGDGFRLPTGQDSFVTDSVLDNDYDVDEGTLMVAGIDVVGTAGTVTPGPGGTFTYENSAALPPGAEDSWDYRVIDGEGGESWATVTIRINTVPQAGNDSIDAHEDDVEVTDSLLGNDTDADGDDLSVTPIDVVLTDGPWTIGRIVVDAAGAYTLTLDEGLQALNDDESVSTIFSYEVTDGFGGFDVADVVVNVEGETDLDAIDDEFSGWADLAAPRTLVGDVTDNDIGTNLTVTHVNGDPIGEGVGFGVTDGGDGDAIIWVFDNGRVDLEVTVPFAADTLEVFTYTVADGTGASDTASVAVTIYGYGDLAQDDTFFATGFESFIGNVLDNDTPGVTIIRANGEDMLGLVWFFVTEPDGPGLADVYVFDDGTVFVEVWEPFASPFETGFWYTVEDALGRTDVAYATILIDVL